MKKKVQVAHSPDSDDAFMFYALATGKIDTGDYSFVHRLDDIESLNQAARQGLYEVTALSIHAYAYLSDQYALLNSGASMGEGYGPVLVAKRPYEISELKNKTVAVPGRWTSAYLALRLLMDEGKYTFLPFDQIVDAVISGSVEAGLLIHEGQLSFVERGLFKVIDLGEWWQMESGLPLPLGGNAVRRDLGLEQGKDIASLIRQSIQYGLEHREKALDYALEFGWGLDRDKGDRFVGMYVNARTLDYGDDGRRAVQEFLDRGVSRGILPAPVKVEFV